MRTFQPLTPLGALADALGAGQITSRALVEQCLERIADSQGEGARVFPFGPSERAVTDADAQDAARRIGRAASRYAGIPISIKDNVDQAGQITRAGSRLLADDPPARSDAPVAARLRGAGFVIMGRTNMTELAIFSGLGVNPWFGTPANPRSPDVKRIPGGSSSGAAVSVGTGMSFAAQGTDTGGSCRIPASFCGLAGFKPTARRVTRDGVFPLSTTLDCVGSLGPGAADCAVIDAVMAGEPSLDLPARSQGSSRLAAITGLVLEDLEPEVAWAYQAALERLHTAGAAIQLVEIPELRDVGRINARAGFSAVELHAYLKPRLASGGGALLDSRVLKRLLQGAEISPHDYRAMHQSRAALIATVAAILDRFDAAVMPTTAIVAPPYDDLVDDDDAFARANALALRNPAIANMLDHPAITLPCGLPGGLPVGLTLMGRSGADRTLLALAVTLEGTVRGV